MYVSPVDFESFLSPTLLIFTRIMGAIMAVRGKKSIPLVLQLSAYLHQNM